MSLQNSRQISDVKVLLKMGSDGAGIIDIELTSSQGNVDTYTITLSNGNKYTFNVTNGAGIDSIEKTGTQGLVDTYTIYVDDGTSYTFTVTNGKDGQDGGSSIMFLITSDAGSTVTVTDPDGTVIPATQVQGSTTEWECEATAFGNYIITSVLGGSTQTQTVTADICKLYTVHVEHFAATIAVTYPTGATCTCVGSSESYTATTNPYTFMVHNADTYTITATDGTHTDSDTVTITTDGQSESVTLSFIPEGATVLPTDDIQIWLHCANIWDKNYTAISEVLADETTVTTLIASTNAVNYMVRSTTWASTVCANSSAMTKIGLNNYCANKLLANSTWCTAICNSSQFEKVLNAKVPTMTSATTPSGVVSTSSQKTGYEAWRAFDKNTSGSDYWQTDSALGWIRYQFVNAIAPFRVQIYTFSPTFSGWRALKGSIQGSNDGTNFTNLISSVTCNNDNNIFNISNLQLTKYKYLRFNATQNNYTSGNTTVIVLLQFWGRIDV